MELIEEFIETYKREKASYENLSSLVANFLENKLIENGIRAIVSHRAKKIDRLLEKLKKRNKKNEYKTIGEIREDIIDLSGVRIALYFPGDKEKVEKIIIDNFDIIGEVNRFPEKNMREQNQNDNNYKKRFSGYWANHYRVKNGKKRIEDIEGIYKDVVVEIQVASLLMHSWSEVEHDMLYKPLSGEVSDEEKDILDELNGLVIVGEIALERLQNAYQKRLMKEKTINDQYDLRNFAEEKKANANVLGDLKTIYSLIDNYNLNTKEHIDNLFKHIDNKSNV